MKRGKLESYKRYKKRRARRNKAVKEHLKGTIYHGFRTFVIDKGRNPGTGEMEERITDRVEKEVRLRKIYRIGKRVNHSLTLKKTNRVKGSTRCRCGSGKLTKNCCGTRLVKGA